MSAIWAVLRRVEIKHIPCYRFDFNFQISSCKKDRYNMFRCILRSPKPTAFIAAFAARFAFAT